MFSNAVGILKTSWLQSETLHSKWKTAKSLPKCPWFER